LKPQQERQHKEQKTSFRSALNKTKTPKARKNINFPLPSIYRRAGPLVTRVNQASSFVFVYLLLFSIAHPPKSKEKTLKNVFSSVVSSRFSDLFLLTLLL
jgi:hypothetical protein